MTLTVDADISSEVDLFGKSVTDLQTNVIVSKSEITGTLNYVTGYTGFSSKTSERKGNYLAIHYSSEDGAVITVEVVGGTSGAKELDADGLIVCKIASTSQSIRVIATKDNKSVTKVFSLSNLTLTPQE